MNLCSLTGNNTGSKVYCLIVSSRIEIDWFTDWPFVFVIIYIYWYNCVGDSDSDNDIDIDIDIGDNGVDC